MAHAQAIVANGKPYGLVAVGLSKSDAAKMANRYRSFGNLARIRKYKSAAGTYRWNVYSCGRVGMVGRR